MLGNDVVDLSDAEARDGPSHPRFDARVFTQRERAALGSSTSPNRLRWSLWAAKEAAYKLGVKRSPGLVFSPSQFVVSVADDGVGSVHYPGGTAELRITTRSDAIHAIASEDMCGEVVAGVLAVRSGRDESREVRELARERVAERLGVAASRIRIGKRGRVPTLEFRAEPRAAARELDLSLSHHGRYVAFACDTGGVLR